MQVLILVQPHLCRVGDGSCDLLLGIVTQHFRQRGIGSQDSPLERCSIDSFNRPFENGAVVVGRLPRFLRQGLDLGHARLKIRDVPKDAGKLALLRPEGAYIEMLIQPGMAALETQWLAGQGDFPIVLDPVGFRARQHFQDRSADDISSRESGHLLESPVDRQETVVGRLALCIEDHFVQRKAIQHLAEEHLIALFQPMKGCRVDQEPFQPNDPVSVFHRVRGKGVIANAAILPLPGEFSRCNRVSSQHLSYNFAGFLQVAIHLGHAEMEPGDLRGFRIAVHSQPGVIDPLEITIGVDLEITRPGILDGTAEPILRRLQALGGVAGDDPCGDFSGIRHKTALLDGWRAQPHEDGSTRVRHR